MSETIPSFSRAHVERAFVSSEVIRAALDVADALLPAAHVIEETASDPGTALRELVRLLGDRGLLGLVVPSAFGGHFDEVSSTAVCLARERLGHASPLIELAFAMQGLGSYPIVARASEAQRERFLPAVAAGESVMAFALTERDAGSDLGGIATTARRDGDHYVLDGSKVFISNAGIADVYVLFAATADRTVKRRLSAFIVEAKTPGLRAVPQRVLGGHPIGELWLDGVRVPVSQRIGDEGDGLSIALETLHKYRPTVGAAALGFAQRALDEAREHVLTRRQFGAPLADLQAVQMSIAEMACDVESARLLVYRAASVADVVAELARQNGQTDERDRDRVGRTGSMAKLMATEAAQRVIDRAVQLHGGRGVELGSVVARLYEDVRALRIYEGASDVQKLLIARDVLKARA